jgi:ligand-binding SRPBCC domain-containing protein
MSYRLEFVQWVPIAIEQVFFFFADPRNLPRIMPPATSTRIEQLTLVAPPPAPASSSHKAAEHLAGVGSEIVTSFRVAPSLPFRRRWIAQTTEFEWNHHFADVQVEGPFRSWLHRHELSAEAKDGIAGTRVCDRIEYEIGYGVLGAIAQHMFVDRKMRATFEHRQSVLEGLLRETRFDTAVR